MFTDTHSHIHFLNEFPDTLEILDRAKKALVNRQIIVGCTPEDSYQALDFVKLHAENKLWSTLGVHPNSADLLTSAVVEKFEQLAKSEEKIVAFGEIGLDYFRAFQPHELQQQAFYLQLRLAKKLNLPVILHVREAWDDALKIVEEVGNLKVILHCFTGDIGVAEKAWKRGYYTSFSGVLTYKKNQYLRDIAKIAPLDQILVETDCPYLAPQMYRGKRNEPAFVVETVKCLAETIGNSLEEMAQRTTQNAVDVFQLDI